MLLILFSLGFVFFCFILLTLKGDGQAAKVSAVTARAVPNIILIR
jgi:hypothetical protein